MSGERTTIVCPVCETDEAQDLFLFDRDLHCVTCPACGAFAIDDFAISVDYFESTPFWTRPRRSALAHAIRRRAGFRQLADTKYLLVLSSDLKRIEVEGITQPSRLEQMNNAIRYLANTEIEAGEVPFETPRGLWALVGCTNAESLANLLMDMCDVGVLSSDAERDPELGGEPSVLNARLSLAGWERWDQIRRGDAGSRDGFIAMQFGDPRLDTFFRDVIQTGVRRELGVQVHRVDSPDKTEAGLIDNIMREAIEDAAFVLVELSHANKGAYWEAGLAEGLRKPVIYLCEKKIWDDKEHPNRPHFDVNHRTTIMWDEDKPEEFLETLVATIKNSLRQKNN